MAQSISPFQIMESHTWSGNTTPYNLGYVFQKDPVKAYSIVTKVLAANNVPDRVRMLEKYPTLKVDSPDQEVTWDLVGSAQKNIQLIEARAGGSVVTSSTANVGIGGAIFKLVFPEHMFFNGDVVVGELNEHYLIRVLGEPQYEGTQVVYDAQLMGSAHSTGMPGSQLVAGKRFSSEGYAPTTLLRHGPKGGIMGSTPFKMKQEMSFIRKDFSVSGLELQRKLNIVMPTHNQKGEVVPSNMAMTVPYKDWQFELEFNKGIGNIVYFGRSNRDTNGEYHDKDDNGEFIKTGAGVREQMQVSNTRVYDVFSIKALTNALYNMVAGKIDMAQAKFKVITGLKGAEQFSEAALDLASGWQTAHSNFGGNSNLNTMKTVSSPIHDNAFSMGFQIVEYIGPNNIRITLEIDPTYDDPVRNKIYKNNNPNDGVAESYRYDVFFVGKVDGENNNIQIVKVKGQEAGLRGYVNGPFGNMWTDSRVGNNNAATQIDEYSCSKIMSIGAVVRDPSTTFTFLPQELAHMQ